jgi:hypothetical protein
MAGSSGASPEVTTIGTVDSQGILALQCKDVNFPGGIIFTSTSGLNGLKVHIFMWMNPNDGTLRIVAADGGPSPVFYDEATNTVTFTAFDQVTSGGAL